MGFSVHHLGCLRDLVRVVSALDANSRVMDALIEKKPALSGPAF